MSREELKERIRERKKALGNKLVILGHHYQRQDVIDFADFRGDSLGLSRLAADQTACEYIVFCGVHFMAESAEIVRQDHQVVQQPDHDAGCPLADMADVEAVRRAWSVVARVVDESSVIPITYMNSSAELKAFCGEKGGAVCTSSNAPKVFEWALTRGRKIFFFPDEHLGRNTARRVGIPGEEISLWDPYADPAEKDKLREIQGARLLLWKGFCHVHTHFRTDHVRKVRETEPDARIVVHPECPEEVVLAADAAGSTEYILRYVQEAPAGSTLYVGTEINFVSRLAMEHPEKTVRELARSLCPNMFRIDLGNLLWTLDGIGEVNRVVVPDDIKDGARLALDRMLQLG
jgi:quinolinate synthase